MLALTLPQPTRWHRIPAASKLAILAVFATALAVIDDPLLLAVAAALSLLPWLTEGAVLRQHALRLAWPLAPVLGLLIGWHALRGAPSEAVPPALRLVATVSLATLVTATTRLDALVSVLVRVLRPLERLSLSPETLALALALVVRSIPVLLDRASRLTLAWRARSARRAGWRLAFPLALSALDDADRTAEALRARRAEP
ncbi:CbiQ family ECF transporter T component [Enterovirga sp. CN4-39]|uniref:CbiQ family ECF transporter T component n=1 Tax=Enterovirga sp. CN4-39 TaxID=3400910 RepID=UPI003C0FBE5D